MYNIDRSGFLQYRGVLVDSFARSCGWLYQPNDPLLISNIYLHFIKQNKIVPTLLRMDAGTRNICSQDLPVSFTDDEESFLIY